MIKTTQGKIYTKRYLPNLFTLDSGARKRFYHLDKHTQLLMLRCIGIAPPPYWRFGSSCQDGDLFSHDDTFSIPRNSNLGF